MTVHHVVRRLVESVESVTSCYIPQASLCLTRFEVFTGMKFQRHLSVNH